MHPDTVKAEQHTAYESLIEFLYRAPIGLLQTTPTGEITLINPMSARLLMPLAANGELSNLFDVLATAAPPLREQAAQRCQAGDVVCESLRVPVSSDRHGQVPQWIEISLLRLDDTTLMGSVLDVTHAMQLEQQRLASSLRDASRTDTLTAMPNRPVVLERIGQALENAAADPAYEFAVLFIDCDRFDTVNMNHGTAVGDELLRQVAGRVNGIVRTGDVVCRATTPCSTAARVGGDEFVVVLEALRHADDVHGIAQRLLDALARPYDVAGNQIHVTVSMGAVGRAHATGEPDAILQDANLAMQDAKRAGGNRYSAFSPMMKETAARRARVESDLRRAIDENELFVVYQPIVALARGACTGVEALVRWRHPTRGVVPPIEFIGIAEETGLIAQLGEFVLRRACLQFVQWQRTLGAKAPRVMSVNLSRAQLAGGALLEQVRSALAESGMAARHLQLEVTESLAAQDDGVQSRLHELKSLGLTLALDDFGTGYSSLASLHQLPVDVVKIDRSFVCQVETSPHHVVLIEATVRVAQSLGMGTVAEGIETPGQARALARLQCDKGQGYLFAKPLTAEDATRWLSARTASDHWLAAAPAAAEAF